MANVVLPWLSSYDPSDSPLSVSSVSSVSSVPLWQSLAQPCHSATKRQHVPAAFTGAPDSQLVVPVTIVIAQQQIVGS
jgi:hypothetical protein